MAPFKRETELHMLEHKSGTILYIYCMALFLKCVDKFWSMCMSDDMIVYDC